MVDNCLETIRFGPGKLRRFVASFAISFVFAVANLSDGYAIAQTVCEPLGDPFHKLEQMKSVFAQGDYVNFFELTDEFSPKEPTETESISQAMKDAFPSGFGACSTLLSEQKSPKMRNEIIFFEAVSGDGVFVAWSAFYYRERWVVAKYSVSTDFETARWASG
ncbi:hypothetical protein RUE5091_02713 [Ruegeria denitrificans]|uniref:Uncharacterized protein n=1 Tax=Ruegeria denitrificans TaxID=1715692 RepID=A0A0P1ICN8_9RHOB|nr:hypothetical protein [Ruegeria denitrificans]CUK05403.1 hypothetical protein RUE5091_02713 [Ruegeria denitrificans]